jgi:hypothetical protein
MHIRNGRVMVPLYAARIEDLGPVDFMVVESLQTVRQHRNGRVS